MRIKSLRQQLLKIEYATNELSLALGQAEKSLTSKSKENLITQSKTLSYMVNQFRQQVKTIYIGHKGEMMSYNQEEIGRFGKWDLKKQSALSV